VHKSLRTTALENATMRHDVNAHTVFTFWCEQHAAWNPENFVVEWSPGTVHRITSDFCAFTPNNHKLLYYFQPVRCPQRNICPRKSIFVLSKRVPATRFYSRTTEPTLV